MDNDWDSIRKLISQPSVIFVVIVLFLFSWIVSCSPGVTKTTASRNRTSTPRRSSTSINSVSSTKRQVEKATVTKTKKADLSGCVDTKALTVRSGPGTQYAVNSYLSEGDCVTLTERNSESSWGKFNDGWVSLAYLSIVGSVSQLPVSTTIQVKATNPPQTVNETPQSISAPSPSLTSAPKQKPTSTPKPKNKNCHPSYPDVCIPPPPPDLDCKHINYCQFRVKPPDPHRFDGDGDGIGCEVCP